MSLAEKEAESRKENTRKISIKEGSMTSAMFGLTSDYITPFALALKSNNLQIGMLNSISSLISPFAQIYGSKLTEKYPRKKIIASFVALQALMWLPIAALSLFFWKDILLAYLPWFLIFFYSLYAILGAIAGPAWFSLMGDIVPKKMRGRYFGKRNMICGTIVIFVSLIASFFLDLFKTHGLALLGFSILFSLASVFRLISFYYFKKHYDPRFRLKKDHYFGISQFFKKIIHTNFGKFAVIVSLFYLSINIGSIFFAVYMLKTLNFSYTAMILVIISSSLFSLLFMPLWGKFSDKRGNKIIIKIGAFLVAMIPILWVLSPNLIYLIFVPQLVSGIGWAAFSLGTNNFIYELASRQNRPSYSSHYNVIMGIGTFFGASLGGLLGQYLSLSFMNIFIFLFLLSGTLGLLVFIILFFNLKENKHLKKF